MRSDQLKEHLFDLGYFSSPDRVDTVDKEDLPQLNLKHPAVQSAVRSFQGFVSDMLDAFSVREHGRIATHDGDAGPATLAALHERLKGCGCPDWDNAATGSGSMPAGCHGDSDEHQMTFGVDKARMPNSLHGRIDAIIERVVSSFAHWGLRLIQLPVEETTNFDISWRHGRGWIGLAQYNQKHCGTYSFCYIDIGYSGSENDEQVAELTCHEVGHVTGLPHVRQGRGVMSPVIRRVRPFAGFTEDDASAPLLTKFYGGEPTGNVNVDLPEIQFSGELKGIVENGRVVIDGEIVAVCDDRSAAAIIVPSDQPGVYVPRPKVRVA